MPISSQPRLVSTIPSSSTYQRTNTRPAPLRKVLPSDYELVFLDGFNTCDAAPGVSGLYPGPCRCWYDTPSSVKVKKGHRALQQYISDEGPFNGVMGFSQGAALPASVLLHHEIEETAAPFISPSSSAHLCPSRIIWSMALIHEHALAVPQMSSCRTDDRSRCLRT